MVIYKLFFSLFFVKFWEFLVNWGKWKWVNVREVINFFILEKFYIILFLIVIIMLNFNGKRIIL